MMPRLAAYLPILLLISACSTTPPKGGYYQDDGPPATPPTDIWQIPEPIPKHEILSKSGNKPYTVFNQTYYPLKDASGYRERGIASWYGRKFHGKRTSSGEPYDMYALTAAHKTLPLPSYVRVRNLVNDRSIVLRVTDRGPFLDNRLIDLSYSAAARLGILGTGTGLVEVVALTPDGATSTDGLVSREAGSRKNLQVTAQRPNTELTAPTPPKLFVQAGAFNNIANARALRARLESGDFKPVNIHTTVVDNNSVHRVRIGPLANVEESDRVSRQVADFGVTSAYIVVE